MDFFEGAEKLLEIWFGRSNESNTPKCDLRLIPRYEWEEVLDMVKCTIISFKKNDYLDAYVLSWLLMSPDRDLAEKLRCFKHGRHA